MKRALFFSEITQLSRFIGITAWEKIASLIANASGREKLKDLPEFQITNVSVCLNALHKNSFSLFLDYCFDVENAEEESSSKSIKMMGTDD